MKYNIDTATIGNLRIAGYSLPTKAINTRLFRSTEAKLEEYLQGNQNGYNLIYSAVSTVPGMSGGPVASSRICPGTKGLYAGLLGVHGMSENYGDTNSRPRISLGVPFAIPKVRSYLISNSERLGIPTRERYIQIISSKCRAPYY